MSHSTRQRSSSERTLDTRSAYRAGWTWILGLVFALALVPTGPLSAGQTGSGEEPKVRATSQDDESQSDDERVAVPRIINPDLYSKSLKAATRAIEHYGLVADNEVLERVNRIGYRIAAETGYDKYPFTFGVVDMPIPNAFALPAGQIFVTQGMLDLGLTDDMLAALLGHEIAHVTQEHFLRMRRRATLLNVLAQVATIGAIAAHQSSRDDYYQGPGGLWQRDNSGADLLAATQTTGVVLSELLLRSYSRENEDESDEVGQRLAVAAGYDPDGARQLMAKMRTRIPQEKSFGYWQTHPFFDERVQAAEARAGGLEPQELRPEERLDSYRLATQETLLGASSIGKIGDPERELIKTSALLAWPKGNASSEIRLDRLHRRRDLELDKLTLSRDYGALLDRYLQEVELMESLDPTSPLLDTLRLEMGQLRADKEAAYPKAAGVLEGGVYEIPFLESFLSNYPESQQSDEVALELGLAYTRLGREREAVEHLLRVWQHDEEGELASQAQTGLRNLAPQLGRLAALEQLAIQERDAELADLALARLESLVASYEGLENGAEYLEHYPQGLYAETVSFRLDTNADTMYREMVLYQQLGDSAKAIARANMILEYAPLSSAARRLGQELESQGISAE